MHPACFVVVAGILAQASLSIFCCPHILAQASPMKRKADGETQEGDHRGLPYVCTGQRPACYKCVHCGQYKPDVNWKPVQLQYVHAETGESVGWPWWNQWNLCDQCYGQVPNPVRLIYMATIEGDGCVQ